MGNAKSSLGHAIYHEDIPTVKQVLQKEPELMDCYFDNEKTSTPITKAISMGSLKIVEYLIEQGADLDIKLNTGEGALTKAAKHGRIQIMQQLLEAPINIHTEDQAGWTPLDYAMIHGYYPMAKMLFDKGLEPKNLDFYISSQKTFIDKKIDFKLMIDCLEQNVDMDHAAAKKRLFKAEIAKEMVFDPNETYSEMFHSLLHFDMPKLVPREDVKRQGSLPENRTFQRLRQIVNWRNTNYLETTKPKAKSEIVLRKAHTEGDVELGKKEFADLERQEFHLKSHGELRNGEQEMNILESKKTKEEKRAEFEKFEF